MRKILSTALAAVLILALLPVHIVSAATVTIGSDMTAWSVEGLAEYTLSGSDSFKIAGMSYTRGLVSDRVLNSTLSPPVIDRARYNVTSKGYKYMSGIFGPVDGAINGKIDGSKTFRIYGDGRQLTNINVDGTIVSQLNSYGGEMPKSFIVDITGYSDITVEVTNDRASNTNGTGTHAMANMYFATSSFYVAPTSPSLPKTVTVQASIDSALPIISAYQSSPGAVEIPSSMTILMAGIGYKNGIIQYSIPTTSAAYYNIDGRYTTMKGRFGPVDGTLSGDRAITIRGDGTPRKIYVNGDDMGTELTSQGGGIPREFSVDVTGIKQIVIEVTGGASVHAVAEVTFSGPAAAPTSHLIEAVSAPLFWGTVTGNGTYYSTGQTATVTATANSGYYFNGWYENGSRVSISPIYSFTVSSWRKLEARFTTNQSSPTSPPTPPSATANCIVAYNANGGGNAPAAVTAAQGASLRISDIRPTHPSGYTFLGWNTNNVTDTVRYQPGVTYTISTDMTLYAVWRTGAGYTVTYDANGGSGAPAAQYKTHGAPLTLRGTVPYRQGYTFLGWSANYLATAAQYLPEALYTADAAVTLYAVWQAVNPGVWLPLAAGNNFSVAIGSLWIWRGNATTPTQISTDAWASVAADGNYIAAIKVDGSLWTWESSSNSPKQLDSATNWASIAVGGSQFAAIKTDGSLWTWSSGANPSRIDSATNWASVAVGGNQFAAIKTDGSLWTWGSSANPSRIDSATNWASVAAGGSQFAAIKTDGSLWTWSSGANPSRIDSATNWASVAVGGSQFAAIKTDGSLWTWGSSAKPAQLDSATDWVRVAAGNNHTAASKSSGAVWAWDTSNNAMRELWPASGGTVTPGSFVTVTDITGFPAAATAGTPLALTGTVSPSHATNRAITWSVVSAGTTGATISGNTLYTTAAGTATIRASVTGGTAAGAFERVFYVTVSAASASYVMYNANGGSNAPATQTKANGTILQLSGNQPARPGYVFHGWNTNGAASAPLYQPSSSYALNADITLYAVWRTVDLWLDLTNASPWAAAQISEAYQKGFIPIGLQSNYKDSITRGEFVYLAMKFLNYRTGKTDDQLLSDRGVTRGTFSDTNDPVIRAAEALGIVTGVGGGRFGVNERFSRQQAALMLANVMRILDPDFARKLAGVPPNMFADMSSAGPWAWDAINYVGYYGIMSGGGGNKFNPLGTFSREMSIVVFNKLG